MPPPNFGRGDSGAKFERTRGSMDSSWDGPRSGGGSSGTSRTDGDRFGSRPPEGTGARSPDGSGAGAPRPLGTSTTPGPSGTSGASSAAASSARDERIFLCARMPDEQRAATACCKPPYEIACR
jgi:hypothetical protein